MFEEIRRFSDRISVRDVIENLAELCHSPISVTSEVYQRNIFGVKLMSKRHHRDNLPPTLLFYSCYGNRSVVSSHL